MRLGRREVGLGDDVEQAGLQRVAGRLKRAPALICQPEALTTAVTALRHAFDHAGVTEAGD